MAIESAPTAVDDDEDEAKYAPSDSEDDSEKRKRRRPNYLRLLPDPEPEPESERPADKAPETSTSAEARRPKLQLVESEPAADTESTAEEMADVDKISPTERLVIERELLIAEQQAEVDQPADVDGTPPEIAAPSAAIELFRELVTSEHHDSASAEAETMAVLGIDADQLVELVGVEEAADNEAGPADIEDIKEDLESEAEPADDDTEDEDTAVGAARATSASSSGSASGSTKATTGGGGSPPPPVNPTGAGAPPTGFGVGGPGGGAGGWRPNLAPAIPVAARTERYDQANPAAMALVGGIVGYLIGRRRGRIKTEKRLLPIQKKLEKEVTNLQWQLQEKQSRIRKVAAEQARTQGALLTERLARATEQRRAKAPETPIVEVPRAESTQSNRLESVALVGLSEQRRAIHNQAAGSNPSRRIEHRAPTIETNGPSASHRPPERIGHVLMAAEAEAVRQRPKLAPEIIGSAGIAGEKVAETSETSQSKSSHVELPTEKRIETLNRVELLALSEKIIIDGSSLRQIYETHLIGERGLRRLVTEYTQGGNVKKALRREVVEREIDFERDPAMRDLPQSAPTVTGGAGKATLDTLLQKADASVAGSRAEEVAFHKARADYEVADQEQRHQSRRLVDISLTVVIVSLIALVIFLFFSRS